MLKKIKFINTQTVEAQGEIVRTFNAGEVYEMEVSSARRWLRRNMATEVQGKAVPKKSQSEAAEPVVKPKRKYVRKPPITASTSESDDSDTGGRPVPLAK